MATTGWTEDPGLTPDDEREVPEPKQLAPVRQPFLEDALRDDHWSFEFFQAVRLLARVFPSREPVGRFAPPEKEVVRFGAHNNVAFPASQIQSLQFDPDGGQPLMRVNFFGLTGPMGVLPMAYTEFIAERKRAKDDTLESFFDIFNHRLLSLFYLAWEKYRFPVRFEHHREDAFSRSLMSLIGIGTTGLQDRQKVPDLALVFYTGLLSLAPKSALALEQILSDYFGVPAEVEQFVGSWYKLPVNDQCSLDKGLEYSEQVGLGAVVGDEVWSHESRVRVRLGPMPLRRYRQFLPGGVAYEPLKALTKFFAGGEMQFEIQLVLERDEVPGLELGAPPDDGPLLGWVSWVKSRPPFGRNPEDTILLLT
ncbi:MAG TPA: type VI secretion system baseplate subunit TssG [Solibacterales bacterium]|nr:type VI secretion system baseplate subunit TssG [Bryobacterales bacterium]